MDLKLTKRNWWKEIGDAQLSVDTEAKLRGAVNAYLHNVLAPGVTEHQFDIIQREVGSISLDGVVLKISVEEGEARRIRLQADQSLNAESQGGTR